MAQNIMIEAESPRINEDINSELLQDDDIEDGENVLLDIDDKSELHNQNRFWMHLQSENGWPASINASKSDQATKDPYDTFMRRHLQHYGYFTGRNASYRNNFDGLENWHRNYDLRLSGTHSLSVDEDQLKKMGHFKSHKNVPLDAGLGQFFAEGQPPDDLLSRTTQLVFHYQAGKKIPKLREPRNLYALTKEPGPQQATRWPSHMQVVSSPIHFIDYTPDIPDPFYVPTGKEATPAVRGTPSGEIIYLNDPGRDIYFMRSRVAGCRMAMRDISLTPRESVDQGNYTLEFESRFESGNLLKAVKINDYDYELTLRPDLYTDKHTQWYFFRVRNMVPGKTYRLTIVNLMKPSSLYNNGMKPLFYSEMDAKKSKVGWTRAGSNIRYYRNNLGSISGRTYYSLTWTIEFPHKEDTCYFAHCYPYTYTDLQEYLLKVANDPVRSRFCKQRVLCRTLAGNLVYILTVTSPSRNPELARVKKAVVLTARVHPGETNASWMMKGFLDFLSGNSPDAKLLRDNFIFKIVPMLNPDGVIVGNYRCSLAGRDLNRNYKSVLKDSFPSVWHTKMMIKRLNMEREVVLYCDLHGHSRKNNIFIYGCENKNNPRRKLKERIFPLMLSKNANTKFAYESCKFKVQRSKEGTGRVVVWLMGVMNSYTMEATFGGTTLGSRKGTHFSATDLEEMGHNFCDTLLDYCDPDASKFEACYQEVQDRLKRQILRRMQMKNVPGSLGDVNIDDYSSDYESDTSGSDSSCDDGLPVHLLAIAPKLQRKRRLKTRRDRNKQSLRKSSAPGHEEPKPTPSHGAKPLMERQSKPVRYSQTATNRKRDEHHPTVSVGTTPQATAFNSDEHARHPKKGCQRVGANKATFVQFNPPHKLINNPVLLPHHHIMTHRKVRKSQFQLSSAYAPLPVCVRAKSVENNTNTPMEDLFRVFSSHLDFALSDEESSRKNGKQSESGSNKAKIKLSPSILNLISQPKTYVDDINIEEIMNYKSTFKKGSSHFQKKSTMSGDQPTKLIQPKPNLPKNYLKSCQSVTHNSWRGRKTLKSEKKDSKTRLQMEYELLCKSKTSKKIFSSKPIADPIPSPEGRRKFANERKMGTRLSSASGSYPINPIVKPQHSSASLRFTNRPQSQGENIQLLYDHMGDCGNDSASTIQKHPDIPVLEGSETENPQKKTINFVLSRPIRKVTKSKIDKIEIYEPKLALHFSKGCKTDI